MIGAIIEWVRKECEIRIITNQVVRKKDRPVLIFMRVLRTELCKETNSKLEVSMRLADDESYRESVRIVAEPIVNEMKEIERYRQDRKIVHIVMWTCLALFLAVFPSLLLLSPSIGSLPCVVLAVILVAAILACEGLGVYFEEKTRQLSQGYHLRKVI